MNRIVDPKHLADAFEHVAGVNHYAVGIVASFTDDDLDVAEQLLINKQNKLIDGDPQYNVLDLALDLIENARKTRRDDAKNQVQG